MAATIDDAINEAMPDIAAISFGGAAPSLATQFQAWIDGMFGAGAIFTDAGSAAQRMVIDWWPLHLLAQQQIEGPNPNDAGIVGNGAVTDVVVRVLYAVKYAEQNGFITTAQRDDVVTLYQNVWD